MGDKYQVDPGAYKRRLEREQERPELKEHFKTCEETIAGQPTFDTEAEAVSFAVAKTRKGEIWTVWVAPKELGGKWKAISASGDGRAAAEQLGWSMIYDKEHLLNKAERSIDDIEEA